MLEKIFKTCHIMSLPPQDQMQNPDKWSYIASPHCPTNSTQSIPIHSPPYTHWPSCCFSNTPGTCTPEELSTCNFFSLEISPPGYPHGLLSQFPQESVTFKRKASLATLCIAAAFPHVILCPTYLDLLTATQHITVLLCLLSVSSTTK